MRPDRSFRSRRTAGPTSKGRKKVLPELSPSESTRRKRKDRGPLRPTLRTTGEVGVTAGPALLGSVDPAPRGIVAQEDEPRVSHSRGRTGRSSFFQTNFCRSRTPSRPRQHRPLRGAPTVVGGTNHKPVTSAAPRRTSSGLSHPK